MVIFSKRTAMSEQKQLSIISKKDYEPRALSLAMRDMGVNSVSKSVVYGESLPTVSRLVKELGYKETASLIVLQLARLEMMLNVSKPMHPEAVAETATMVVDSCINAGVCVNAADIDIIFKRAAKGEYGKIYGGISCAEVLRWFIESYVEKSEAYVQYNMEKSSEYNYYSPRWSDGASDRAREHHKAAVEHYMNLMNKKK